MHVVHAIAVHEEGRAASVVEHACERIAASRTAAKELRENVHRVALELKNRQNYFCILELEIRISGHILFVRK